MTAPANADLKAELDRAAEKRKRSLVIGLTTLGAFALTAGGIFEAARRQQLEQERICAAQRAGGATLEAACAPRASGHSSSSSAITRNWGAFSSSSGAATSHSTTSAQYGGFGAHASGGGG
jgi:hypothetical protein